MDSRGEGHPRRVPLTTLSGVPGSPRGRIEPEEPRCIPSGDGVPHCALQVGSSDEREGVGLTHIERIIGTEQHPICALISDELLDENR